MENQLKKVKENYKIKLHISENLLNKIKYLCRNIYEVEWSGVLFYSMKGSIRDIKTLEFTVEDILPMDMGNKTYTEYELDNRFVDYLMEDEKRMDYKVGHIHSHNTMNVFFSGTDMDELKENSNSHNFYLSLIVNNYMDFEAKVGFIANTEKVLKQVPFEALDENGKRYLVEKKDLIIKKEFFYTHDCEVIANVEKLNVDEGFMTRVKGIIDKAKKVFTPVVKQNNISSSTKQKFKTPPDLFSKFSKSDNPFEEDEEITEQEQFAVCVLNFTPIIDAEMTLEESLALLEDYEMSKEEVASCVLHTYVGVYENFYDYETDPKLFISRTEDFIDLLRDYEETYEFVPIIIDMTIKMLTKFEDYATTV